jgi:putative FmdB family regulatory protein
VPTYSYRCEKCGKKFEVTETMAEHDVAKPRCPKCGAKKRVVAVPGRVYVVTTKKS